MKSGGPFGYERLNVADQRRDPASLLNVTERMIRTRKECPELGWGDFELIPTGRSSVLAIIVRWRGNRLVLVHNFAAAPCEVSLAVGNAERAPLTNLLTADHALPNEEGQHRLALEPYGYRWYRVGPLLETLHREPR